MTTATLVPVHQRLDVDALVPGFSRAMSALDDAAVAEADRTGLDPVLRELTRLRASQLNGCAYCVDLHSVAATVAALGEEGAAALLALLVTINAWNAIGVTARCWAVPVR